VISSGFTEPWGTGERYREDFGSHVSWEVGRMFNRKPNTARGGTVHFGIGSAGFRVGLKGKYRRWIGTRGALDVSAGLLRTETQGSFEDSWRVPAAGVTGDVAFGWGDLGAVSVRADALRANGRTVGAVYGGVRLGGVPAIAATGGAAIAFAVAYLMLVSAY
jgi:hypothetical protein